jgi:hypothetical protein
LSYRSTGKQSFCHPYHNKRTDTDVEGCGKEVKWIEADTQWGKKNQKVNMDGSKHVCTGGKKMPGRTADMEPVEYQQLTGPTQAAKGYEDSKYGNMFKEYLGQSTGEIKEAAVQLIQATKNLESKATSGNVNEILLIQKVDQLTDKVDAILASNSFQGADKIYKHQHSSNPASGEVILPENGEETVEDEVVEEL